MSGDASADWRPGLVTVLSAAAVAGAAYLLPASVHLIGWNGSSAARVAMLPPAGRLAWAAAISLAAAGIAIVWCRRTRGRLEALAATTAPLCILWLWWVPYLPWVPSRVPMLLLLAGPLRWGAAALAAIGCARAILSATGRLLAQPRLTGRTVFLVSLLAMLLLGWHVKRVQGLGGDEPHYLVISHSLLADGDLQIENNHKARHYADFSPGILPPHFLRRGANGAIYSIHAPGLPALLLPFYAAGGHWGAFVFIVLAAALAARAVFDLAEQLTSSTVAAVTWAAVTFSIPFGLQSGLIFPEIPAALVMAWSAQWLWARVPDRAAPWVWRGAALGLLPWLHTKFALLTVAVAVWMLVKIRWRPGLAAAFLLPIAFSVAGWLLFFYLIYGTPNPTVAYGYARGAGLALSNVPRGLLGLFLDQEYGLLVYSPVYALAVAGAWTMVRSRDLRWPAVALVATIAAFAGATTQYYMWWGGTSVPARFLVPILPLVAPLVAVAVHQLRSHGARALAALAVGLSIATFALVVADPGAELMYNDRDGTSRLLELLQARVPLTATLPSFIAPDWVAQLPKLAAWIAAALAAVGITMLARRRQTGPMALAVLAVAAFGVSGSLLATPLLASSARATALLEGRLGLLAAFDGSRTRAVDLETRTVLTLDRLLDRTSVTARVKMPEGGDPIRVAGPWSFAPGRYDIWVGFDGRFSGAADAIHASYGRGPGVLARGSVSPEGRIVLTLDLPVALSQVWIGSSDRSVAGAIGSVRIEPRAVVPRSERERVRDVRAAHQVGDEGFIFYLGDGTFPEEDGYWVVGGRAGAVLVAPGRASALEIRVQNGATAGPVTINTPDRTDTLDLGAGESQVLHVAVSDRRALVPIAISSREGFRPSEVDPRSDDVRWLGCRVHIFPTDGAGPPPESARLP